MGETVKRHLAQTFFIPLLNQRTGHRIQFLILLVILNEEPVGDHILTTVQQNTSGWLPVTSCTPCFLIIALHILRHIIVDHIPYIRFINSHSKCIGSYHDPASVINEVVLIVPALFV